MENNKTKVEYNPLTIEVAKKIWDIAKISPEHGNELMDLIGYDTYFMISKLQHNK